MMKDELTPLRCGLSKDAEDSLDTTKNQYFNRQRNTEASQVKYFIRGTHSRVSWSCDQERSQKGYSPWQGPWISSERWMSDQKV